MIPVALFVYNRPAHLARVLEGLKRNNIGLLYVFSDAPKSDDRKDAEMVKAVRSALDSLTWARVEVFKSQCHRGPDDLVKDGVSKMLSVSDKIIVLEDDCVPGPYFYDYMCQCLDYYEDEERISCISAYLHPVGESLFKNYPYDVFFWRRFWSWGWGTWRRVWQKFEFDMETLLNKTRAAGIDTSVFGEDVSLRGLERKLKNALASGKAPPWDAPFFLSMVLSDTFAVYPVKSHIRNIGFDGSGASCGISNRYNVNVAEEPAAGKLRFPPQIKEDQCVIRHMLDFINYNAKRNYSKIIKFLLRL